MLHSQKADIRFIDPSSPQKWIHPAKDIKEGTVFYQAKVIVYFFYCKILKN